MSGYRDFQCPSSHDLENSDLPMDDILMTTPRVRTSLLSPVAYLPCSFYRSDGCQPFRKFEWDPMVTGSLSSFSSANSCILSFAARIFLNVVSRPNPQGILSFLSCHLHFVLAINGKHTLLVKHLPTQSSTFFCLFGFSERTRYISHTKLI
jgi:hypothetical protein